MSINNTNQYSYNFGTIIYSLQNVTTLSTGQKLRLVNDTYLEVSLGNSKNQLGSLIQSVSRTCDNFFSKFKEKKIHSTYAATIDGLKGLVGKTDEKLKQIEQAYMNKTLQSSDISLLMGQMETLKEIFDRLTLENQQTGIKHLEETYVTEAKEKGDKRRIQNDFTTITEKMSSLSDQIERVKKTLEGADLANF